MARLTPQQYFNEEYRAYSPLMPKKEPVNPGREPANLGQVYPNNFPRVIPIELTIVAIIALVVIAAMFFYGKGRKD